MLHWLNFEYWQQSWPNIFAPSVWTLAGIALAHWRTRVHLARHHQELREHVDRVMKEGT